jgi:two-component system chemotaxis sensor kinase CheA
VNFFSEERASELRELFFESAQELLQALNEQGLELEKRPSDAEVIRTIRRTVHTLKGDSAACGFRELSELAHELEDVLTSEIAARNDHSVAQVVLSAADTFDAMLEAYKGRLQPPDFGPLRELIGGLAVTPAQAGTPTFSPKFAWSEYERLTIAQGAGGTQVFNVGIQIDPQCPMLTAASQLVRNALLESGRILATHPEDWSKSESLETIEAAIASEHDQQWIARKCRIPAVVSNIAVQPLSISGATAVEPQQDPMETVAAQDAQPAATQEDGGATAQQPSSSSSPAPDAPLPTAPAPSAEPAARAEAQSQPTHTVSENILRVDAERIDTVLNLLGELIIARSMLSRTITEFSRRFPKDSLRVKFTDTLAHQSQVLNELQRSVMKIRMVPVEQLFRRFPRVVRDIGKRLGKEAVLEVTGQDTDLDKSILDALAEPMSHLVRNAVDHGLEGPEERVAAGKPAQGRVHLKAFHQGNQVVIEVSDDGRGINRQQVAAKALERGLVTQDELSRMGENEVLELIFESGLSTAKEVTQVSGRGVGLDVVKAVLARMKGAVSVQTRAGEGTTFQLRVPLTLAIIKALLFRVGQRLYALPLGAVLEITRATEREIHKVDQHEVLQLRDEVLTLVRLSRLTGNIPAPAGKRLFIIVVAVAGRKFGLIVDRLVGEEELVIKALDDHLVSTDLVSGASILGDGAVVLILNIIAIVAKLGRTRGISVETNAGELPAGQDTRDTGVSA